MSAGLKAAHKRGKIAARYWFAEEFYRRGCLLLNIEYHGEEDVFTPKGLTRIQKATFARAFAHEAWRLYRNAGYPSKARLKFLDDRAWPMGRGFDPYSPIGFQCSDQNLLNLKSEGVTSPLEIAVVEQIVNRRYGWYSKGGAMD